MNRKFMADALERTGATAVAAGAGYLIPIVAGLPDWWQPILVSALTVAKVAAARFVGDRESAALAPGGSGQ